MRKSIKREPLYNINEIVKIKPILSNDNYFYDKITDISVNEDSKGKTISYGFDISNLRVFEDSIIEPKRVALGTR